MPAGYVDVILAGLRADAKRVQASCAELERRGWINTVR
jgi:hypothetical protein